MWKAVRQIQQRIRQASWHWRGVLIAVPSVTAAVLGLRAIGLLQTLEFQVLDHFFALRPREAIDSRIVIVEISEADVQAFGWPISDIKLAELLEAIKQQQPIVIGLDLYRDLPLPPGHATLETLFQQTPNLIGIQKVVGSAESSAVAPPPSLKRQGQVGANDLPLDGDGKIRRGLLFLADGQGETISSFGFQLAAAYLQTKGIEASLTPDQQVKLGSAILPQFHSNTGAYVNADSAGYQLLLNYRGTQEQFTTVTMRDVLAKRGRSDLMRDRIVLIGTTAESLKDIFYVPYSRSLTTPTRLAGVAIHANLVSQLVSTALDGRPSLQTWSEPLEMAWILVWATIGAVLSWQQRLLKRPWNLICQVSLGGAAIGLIGLGFAAFLQSWWIPVVPPLLSLAGSAVVIMGYIARSTADMRRTFGRYLTDEVVARLLETPTGLNLGGERRQVTVLVSDLRGFSTISERLPPEQVVNILNLYLGAMSEVISQYQGTINEFIGDGMFVLFGAPIQRDDDSQRAIACAIAMQTAMASVNQQNRQLGFPDLEMGIGINTGEMVVGNIGSQKRAKYTVIGSHANLAARIESYTVGGQVLISEHTLRNAGDSVYTTGQMQVEPKGIREPVMLYDVGGIAGKYAIALSPATDEFVTIDPPIPLHYSVWEGKHVVGTLFRGRLVRLSSTTAEIRTNHLLTPLSNLKLTLLLVDAQIEEIYAKVLTRPAHDRACVQIRFTGLVPEVAAALETLRRQMAKGTR